MASMGEPLCMMTPYNRATSAESPSLEPLHDRGGGLVAGPAGWPGQRYRLLLRIDPKLRSHDHPLYPGNPGGAPSAGHQADPIDAVHAGNPAEGEGPSAEVQGEQAKAQRGDDGPLQGARGQPIE